MGAPYGNCNACKRGRKGTRSVSKGARKLLHFGTGRTSMRNMYGRKRGDVEFVRGYKAYKAKEKIKW
jgi:hypothetical protein